MSQVIAPDVCMYCDRPETEVELRKSRCVDVGGCRAYRTPLVRVECPSWCIFAEDEHHVAEAVDGPAGQLIVSHSTNAADGWTMTQLVAIERVTGRVVEIGEPHIEIPEDEEGSLSPTRARLALARIAELLKLIETEPVAPVR